MDESVIQNILANGTQCPEPKQKAREMLVKWSQMIVTPTYRKLEEALEEIGRPDLADWLYENSA